MWHIGKEPACPAVPDASRTLVQHNGMWDCQQVVKSDSATVSIPELEFEIPAATQRGCITTVEGLLREAGAALGELQPQRRAHDAATAAAIDDFLGAHAHVIGMHRSCVYAACSGSLHDPCNTIPACSTSCCSLGRMLTFEMSDRPG